MLAGFLMLLLHVIVLSGIGPIEILWPIWVVAGGIGFPLFAFGMSRTFARRHKSRKHDKFNSAKNRPKSLYLGLFHYPYLLFKIPS